MNTSDVVQRYKDSIQRYKETPLGAKLEENKSALLVVPGFLLWAAFMVLPMLYLLILSFTNADNQNLFKEGDRLLGMLPLGQADFIGLKNYQELLFSVDALNQGFFTVLLSDPVGAFNYAFWNSILVTFLFVIVSVVGKVVLGVGLSMVMTGNRVRGKRFFRGILIMPMGIPVIFSITVWRFVFSDARFGMLNDILRRVGIIEQVSLLLVGESQQAIAWFQHRWLAFGTYVITEMWLAYPFMMLITVSALQNVNAELLDAAEVDGAGWFARFWHVILPSIKRPVMFGTILTSAASFQQFLVPWIFNSGGPGTNPGKNALILVYAYKEAFRFNNYAQGGAIGLTALIFIGVFMIIAVKRGNLAEEAGET